LRLENEEKIRELTERQAEKTAEQEAELTSLHQELSDYTKRYEEVAGYRQKLEESQALHSSTLEELNRIHEDKLQSLEIELQAARQERLGAEDEIKDKYGLDLDELRLAHQEELTQQLVEHGEEVEALKKLYEEKIEEARDQAEVL
jgi:chromosome segregation ATPase